MKKETFNLTVRLIAGVAAALILVSGMVLLGGKLDEGRTGALYQASGMKLSDTMLTIEGQDVTVEEYLYYLTVQCSSAQAAGITDLDMIIGEGVSAADYAAQLAVGNVTNRAVVDAWAAEVGIAMTAEEVAEMNTQLDSADYADAGVSRQFLETQARWQYLSNHILEEYSTEGGKLYPDEAAIQAAMAAGEDHGHEHDLETVLMELCNEEFAQRCNDAEIVYNEKYDGKLNVKAFYEKMVELTTAAAQG